MTQAVQSPEEPVMVTALPRLYSPRMEELLEGPLRKRTYMAFMYPLPLPLTVTLP